MTADDNQETVIRASINAYLEELSPRLLELNHSVSLYSKTKLHQSHLLIREIDSQKSGIGV